MTAWPYSPLKVKIKMKGKETRCIYTMHIFCNSQFRIYVTDRSKLVWSCCARIVSSTSNLIMLYCKIMITCDCTYWCLGQRPMGDALFHLVRQHCGIASYLMWEVPHQWIRLKLSLKRFCLIMIFSISIMNFSILWWILVFNEF